MRYKIVEKASGEVQVYCEDDELIGSGKYWELLPDLFTCIEDARKYIQNLKLVAKLDEIKREEIIDV